MNTEREKYEGMWSDIKIFVEYACMRDRKFYERAKSALLFEKTDGKMVTLDEYLENAKGKNENTVYYTSDKVLQAQYLDLFSGAGIEVVVLDKVFEAQFAQMLEQDRGIKFLRIDSSVADALKGEGDKMESEALVSLFRAVSQNNELEVVFEALKSADVPAILNVNEESRRFDDMMKMYSMGADAPSMAKETLILNSNSALIKKLAENPDESVARQLYTLTLMSRRRLSAAEMTEFLKTAYGMLEDRL
jgi:molecular chaperone HtpG